MSIQTPTPSLSLNDILRFLRGKIPLILLIVVLVMGVATIIAFLLPERYRATVTIRVEKPSGTTQLFSPDLTTAARTIDPLFVAEQLDIITSRKVLEQVIDNMGLISLYSEQFETPLTLDQTYQILRGQIGAGNRTGTSIIDIGVGSDDPELAAKIANEIAEVYAEDRIAFVYQAEREGIEKLYDDLEEQRRIVAEKRDEVERIRKEENISAMDINLDLTAVDVENIRNIESTLINFKVEEIARKTRWEKFKEIPPGERIAFANDQFIVDPTITNLLQAYQVAQQQVQRMSETLGKNHPDIVAMATNRDTIRGQLVEMLAAYEESLEIAYLEAKSRVEELERQLQNLRDQQISRASGAMRRFDEAVEQLRDEESLLRALKITLRQKEIDFGVPKRNVEVLNRAVPPERPASPQRVLWIAGSAVFGLILGLGVALLVEISDTSIRSVEDLERALQKPILGVVPKRKILIDTSNYHTFEFEPYRVLHTNLTLATGGGPAEGKEGSPPSLPGAQVYAVQSAGPGEGKSTTLFNLGGLIALSGQKVLIIDTDMRRPQQHNLTGCERKPGLSEYFNGESELGAILQQTAIPDLHFIASGRSSHVTLSFLHAKKLDEILAQAAREYDVILLDSPPLIGVSDSSVIASRVKGVVLVVQHRRNPASMTIRAKETVENVGGEVLGIVMNQVPNTGDEDYGYYTANYAQYGGTSASAEGTTGRQQSEGLELDEGDEPGRRS